MSTQKMLDAKDVATHNTLDSCWVILYGNVYDVTDFLPSHPGGSKIILQLAGKDATEEYDPVHPEGTLESALPKDANLGPIDPKTIDNSEKPSPRELEVEEAPLDTLLNLDDMEKVAERKLSAKAWAYYHSAADDMFSKQLNTSAYRQILFRPRVFIDVEHVDTTSSILGHKISVPIYVAPAAMARLAHPAGERGIGVACGKQGILQVVSNNASQTIEEVVSTPVTDEQVWGFQLYAQTTVSKSEQMLQRVEQTGKYKFVVLTLDAPVPGKRELDERTKNATNGPVTSAVGTGGEAAGGGGLGKALFAGTDARLTWKKTIPWLTRTTKLPLMLKGIQTWEDAKLASMHPEIRGIVLSNHGGRSLDGSPPAIYTLLEIRRNCPEVFDRLDVLIDGGVKRGTDVVKALCLGAKAVGIGRAVLFGLGVGGIEGVERTIQILRDEIATSMRLLGVTSVSQLGMQYINTRAIDHLISDGREAQLAPYDARIMSKL